MGALTACGIKAGCWHEAHHKDYTGRFQTTPALYLLLLVMLLLFQTRPSAAQCITTETICKPFPHLVPKRAAVAVTRTQRVELSANTRQLLQDLRMVAVDSTQDEYDGAGNWSGTLEAFAARCSIYELLVNTTAWQAKLGDSPEASQQQQQLMDRYDQQPDTSSINREHVLDSSTQLTALAHSAVKHRLLLAHQHDRSSISTDKSSASAATQRQLSTQAVAAAHRRHQTAVSAVRASIRRSPDGVVFLSSNRITAGVDPQHGGALVYLSSSEFPQPLANMNLVNIWDSGRLIQQSYYGCYDGSCWLHKPWRWNPVQGGSWQNLLPKVNQLDVDEATGFVRVLVNPRNWGGQELMRDVHMKTHVNLWEHGVKVRFSMRYTGNASHPVYHQEVPAVYLHRKLGVLASYTGSKPWSNDTLTFRQPGEQGQYYQPTEQWAAYLDPKSGYGVGVYSPVATQLVAYRVGPDGSGARQHCSYFAPITTQKIKPGREFSYNVYIAVGQVDDLRRWFGQVAEAMKHRKIEVQRRLTE